MDYRVIGHTPDIDLTLLIYERLQLEIDVLNHNASYVWVIMLLFIHIFNVLDRALYDKSSTCTQENQPFFFVKLDLLYKKAYHS